MCIMLKMIACDGVCLLYMDHLEPLPIWVINYICSFFIIWEVVLAI